MSDLLPKTSKKGYSLLGDKAHALLIHGYTGSPYDLRPLANFLSAHGIGVTVPLLKGHGTHPRDLFKVTAEDWLSQVTDALRGLDASKPIIVGGLSMGGLLAILLAAEVPTIRTLLLFSPSLKLTLMAELTIAAAQIGLLDKKSSFKKLSGGSDIADPVAKKKTPAYLEMPIAGLLEFEKLRIRANSSLAKISCPIFMAFGQHDGAIDALEAQRMLLMGSRQPIVSKFYPRSKHVITLDFDRERLFDDTWQFLTQKLGMTP